jgi:hypothetical protein
VRRHRRYTSQQRDGGTLTPGPAGTGGWSEDPIPILGTAGTVAGDLYRPLRSGATGGRVMRR